jgi:hypothetical protein
MRYAKDVPIERVGPTERVDEAAPAGRKTGRSDRFQRGVDRLFIR